MALCKSSPRFRQLQTLLLGFLILFAAQAAAAQIRTVLVSPVPGDPVASGTALRNALAGISSPSSTNRWLLKIEPGIYDVSATPLQMRSWVDIEGSGMGVTTVRGSVQPFAPNKGTVNGASNAELRLLTVEATGNSTVTEAVAMYNGGGASPRLYRVKLVAQASDGAWGMRNSQSAPLLDECEITASATAAASIAYGIEFTEFEITGQRSSILRSKIAAANATFNYGVTFFTAQTLTEIRDSRIDVTGGTATIGIYAHTLSGLWTGQENLVVKNVDISSFGGSSESYGVFLGSGTWVGMDISNSKVWGHVSPTTYGIRQQGTAAIILQASSVVGFTKTIDSVSNVSIASTQLYGGPVTVAGWLGCMGVWDEGGVFYTNSCPP